MKRIREMTDENKNRELIVALGEFQKQIESDAKRLSRERKSIADLKKALERGEFSKIKQILSYTILEDVMKDYPNSEVVLSSLNKIADEEIEKSLTYFSRDFISEIEKQNLKIDWWFPEVVEGSLPKFTINKMIEVEVDRKNNKVKVNDQLIKGFDINRICSAIASENKRIFCREFNAETFLENLSDAYLTVVKKNNYMIGDAMPIIDVYQQMILSKQTQKFWRKPNKANFRPYMLDEFGVDISRLLMEKKVKARNNLKFELVPVRSPKDSIFITMPDGDRVYRGMIRFKRVENE